MGGVALLARELGHEVTGTDAGAWPPMSDLLAEAGIPVREGYSEAHLLDGAGVPDEVLVGNALSRGNEAVEAVLNRGLAYTSGPAWLAREVLGGRRVLAVGGTHGKTTTAAACAWILERTGRAPGWLIGGAPGWSRESARLGQGDAFVVEGDEYDTAFFDKRAKLVHYRPHVLILNNLEYDHADIYPDIGSIAQQFHHAVRTVPGNGRILVHAGDPELEAVLERGCWSPVERFGTGPEADWRHEGAAGRMEVHRGGRRVGAITAPLAGEHNRTNLLAAIAGAVTLGVPAEEALAAAEQFPGVRRRLEHRGTVAGIAVIDDFAHHPTAIRATCQALTEAPGAGGGRLLGVVEPRSNTMRMGVHHDQLADALSGFDHAFVLEPGDAGPGTSVSEALTPLGDRATVRTGVEDLLAAVLEVARPGDRVVVMSNGGFEGFHDRLLQALEAREAG